MKEFDEVMVAQVPFFVRYSDDMLFLGKNKEELEQAETAVANYLGNIGLGLSEDKRCLVPIENGFEYLGYHFDKKGKAIGKKAEETLKERLELMWLTSVNHSAAQKLKKGSEILGGWEQYYRPERTPGDILECAVALYMSQNKSEEFVEKYGSLRFQYDNPYPDLLEWLVEYWNKKKMPDYALMEYEQYFHKLEYDSNVKIDTSSSLYSELLTYYSKLLVHPGQEEFENLVQAYSDLGCYDKASAWQKELEEFLQNRDSYAEIRLEKHQENSWMPDISGLQMFLSLFVGREDLYGIEKHENGRRVVETVYEPLTENVLKKHFNGEITVQSYVKRPNATVCFWVVDLDVSKKILLQHKPGSDAFESYLKKILGAAVTLKTELGKLGLISYLEFSGYRGYHLWVFFKDWIPLRYVNLLQEYIESHIKPKILPDEDVQMEFFPNKGRNKGNKPGQCIKLPYGVHTKSLQISYFLEKDGLAVADVGHFLQNVVQYSLKTLKKIIGCMAAQDKTSGNEDVTEMKEVDKDLSPFGQLEPKIQEVLRNCSLMRYLCQKARKTSYLGHFERLSILYVFGHLGEEGKQFIHTVMEFTMNYQYHITEKFIHRLPEKPISCIKLREQYKDAS